MRDERNLVAEFNAIAEEDAALANGTAIAARIVSADGREIFSCD